MTSIKDLKKRAALLAKQVQVDKVIFNAAMELIEKKKIAKPEKVYRDSMPKISRKDIYNFVMMDMGQKKYFMVGDVFPMGAALSKKIDLTRKQVAKAEKPVEKEFLGQMLFFYEQLDKLSMRGYATGTIKFSREAKNEQTGVTECTMAIKPSDMSSSGTVKKATIVELVNENLGYSMVAKSGEVMFLEMGKEKVVSGSQETDSQASTNMEQPTDTKKKKVLLTKVKLKLKSMLDVFKKTEPKQSYKRLSMIHNMNIVMDKIEEEERPENMVVLSKNLNAQKERILPVFDKQISHKFDKSMTKIEEIELVETTAQLQEIVDPLITLDKSWDKFTDSQREHSKSKVIKKMSSEIDILAHYEAIIVPKRKQFERMKDSVEKQELGEEINNLIKEARQAIS